MEFPTSEDIKRIKKNKDLDNLYSNEAEKVFKIKNSFTLSKKQDELLYIAVNLPAIIAEFYADLIIGEGIKIDVEDEESQNIINDFIDDNDLNIKLYESGIVQSINGYFVFRIVLRSGKIKVEPIPVNQYFAEYSNDIVPIKTKDIIASYVEIKTPLNKKVKCIYKQSYFKIDEKVYLEHTLFQVNNKGQAEKMLPVSWYDPSLDEAPIELPFVDIPVYKINNTKSQKTNFGKSDIEYAMPLLEELNEKVTQISLQLTKHMNSKIAVPSGTLNDNGTVRASEAELFEVGSDGVVPSYIVNPNPQIDQAFIYIEKLIRLISSITKVPVDSLGIETKGGQEKVEAIRLKMFSSNRKVSRKRKYHENSLKKIIKEVLNYSDKNLTNIQIKWSDVLPTDHETVTKYLSNQMASGLKSQKKAVQELQNIFDSDLIEELNEIKAEEVPSVPSFNNNPPRINNINNNA